jgi:hypothetical protein
MRTRRIVGVLAAASLVVGAAAPVALATGDCKPPAKKCKPGYGYGDKNHCHFGPPGLGFSPTNPYR